MVRHWSPKPEHGGSIPRPFAHMLITDLTGKSPKEYRIRTRPLSEIRAVVLHQVGFDTWEESSPSWARIKAHLVVLQSGAVLQLHPITARMRWGCGPNGNRTSINVELAGNYPLSYNRAGKPRYWKPDKFGRSTLSDSPAQVEAARALLASLAEQVPGLEVGAHRQLEKLKSGCCGPDIWSEVGQYAVDHLGMPEMPTNGGLDIPDDWREIVHVPV